MKIEQLTQTWDALLENIDECYNNDDHANGIGFCNQLIDEIQKYRGNEIEAEEKFEYFKNTLIKKSDIELDWGQYQETVDTSEFLFNESEKYGSLTQQYDCAIHAFDKLLNISDYNKMLEYAQKANKIAQELGSSNEIVKSLVSLAAAYNLLALFHESIDALKQGLALINNEVDGKIVFELYNWLASSYKQIANYEKAEHYQQLCLNQADLLNDNLLRIQAYDNIIQFYISKGRLPKAYNLSQKAIVIAEDANANGWVALFNSKLGKIMRGLGNYNRALYYFNKSEHIFKTLNYNIDAVNYQNEIGLTYRFMGKFIEGKNIFESQLVYAEKMNLKADISLFTYNTGCSYYFLNELDKAEELINKALVLDTENRDEYNMAYCNRLLGQIKQAQGAYDKAFEFFDKALDIDTQIGEEFKSIEDNFLLGDLFFECKNYDLANDYFSKVDTYLGTTQDIVNAANFAFTIGSFYARYKKFYEAQNYFRLAKSYFKEIENHARIAYVNLYYAYIQFERGYKNTGLNYLSLLAESDFLELESFFTHEISRFENANQRTQSLELIKGLIKYAVEANNLPAITFLYNILACIAHSMHRYDWVIEFKLQSAEYLFENKKYERANEILNDAWLAFEKTKNVDHKNAIELFEKKLEIEKNSEGQSIGIQLYNKADVLFKSNINSVSALYYLSRAKQIFEPQSDNEYLAKIFLLEGEIYESLHQFDDAIGAYKVAIEFYKQLTSFDEIADAYERIGYIYSVEKNTEQRMAAIKKAIEYYEKVDNSERLMRLLNQLGIRYVELNDYSNAESYYNQSLEKAIQLEDNAFKISLYYNLGLLACHRKEKETFESYYNQALEIAENIQDNEEIGIIYLGFAEAYDGFEDYEKAQQWINKSFNHNFFHAKDESNPQKSNDFVLRALAYINLETQFSEYMSLSEIQLLNLIEIEENNEALLKCDEILELLLENNQEADLGKFYLYKGDIYFNERYYKDAEPAYFKALNYSQKYNDRLLLCHSNKALGWFYYSVDEFDKAVVYLKQAIDWAEIDNNQEQLADLTQKLGKVFSSQQKYTEAEVQFLKSFDFIKDTDKYHEQISKLRDIAGVYYELEKSVLLKKCLEQSIDIAQKSKLPHKVIDAYYEMASYLAKNDDYQQAITFFNKAIAMGENILDDNKKAILKNDLAICIYESGKIEKSIEILEELNIDLRDSQHDDLKSLVFRNLGDFYNETEQFDKSIAVLEQNLQLQLALDHEEAIAKAFNKLGNVFLGNRILELAHQCFSQAIDWSSLSDNSNLLILSQQYFGNVLIEMQEYQNALTLFVENQKFCESEENYFHKNWAAFFIAKIYFMQKEYPQALELLNAVKKWAQKNNLTHKFEEAFNIADEIRLLIGESTFSKKPETQKITKGASEKEIDDCLSDLFDNDIAIPPNDYFDFLRSSNGWTYNGSSLFGTFDMEYRYSLLTANNVYSKVPNLNSRLVVGKEDESLIVFDYDKRCYQIVDRMDCLVYEEFKAFNDLWDYLKLR